MKPRSPVRPKVHTPLRPFSHVRRADFKEAGLEPGTVEGLIVKHLAVVGSATGG